MKHIAITLFAGAAALSAGSATAADFYTNGEYVGSDVPLVQSVRLICDEAGRCYRIRGDRRVYEDSYDYVPRDRYIERRYYDDRPRAGFGFSAPGVSVGVGVDR
jgi:hypothetical protein